MANEKLVTLDQLGIVKNYIDVKDASAIKSAEYANNKISLFTTADKSGTAAVELSLPEEMFLDQAKTVFVESFTWNDTAYPGSIDPSLEGKPVMVLAVKGDNSVNYSFLSLEKLIKTYTGDSTDTTEVIITDGVVKANVKVSAEEGNAIVTKTDGLYVPPAETPQEIVYATNAEVSALFETNTADV